MTKFNNKFRIESSRRNGWDYSSPWLYFVTINTEQQYPIFGEIENGRIILNELGKIADRYWNEIPLHFKNIKLDNYVIMPDHIHGIINILDTAEMKIFRQKDVNFVKTPYMASLLGNVIGKFKGAVTRWAKANNYSSFKWQTRFYDRVIRDTRELFYVRDYIEMNPLKTLEN
jgi:REP element-mobilizing transposase RayT